MKEYIFQNKDGNYLLGCDSATGKPTITSHIYEAYKVYGELAINSFMKSLEKVEPNRWKVIEITH